VRRLALIAFMLVSFATASPVVAKEAQPVTACGDSQGPGSRPAAGGDVPARERQIGSGDAAPQPPPPVRGRRVPLSSLRGSVAFSRGGDIWIADADGSHARRVTRTRGPQDDPTWSPDGRTLAYRDAHRGYNMNDEIYTVDAGGASARNLTRTPFNEWSPAWSPNGKLIAFYASELYVMRPDGRDVRQVTQVEGEYPAWAPDGRRLVFMSAQPGTRGNNPNYDIFVVNVDGTGLKQLTDWPGEDGWPAWSPDGRWIAFSTTHYETGDSPGRSVYLMRPDGSDKHRLAVPLAASFPIWSPDGKTIMFTATRRGEATEQLWVMRPDGTGWRRTSMEGGIAAWSPRER
jgi:TolB protein